MCLCVYGSVYVAESCTNIFVMERPSFWWVFWHILTTDKGTMTKLIFLTFFFLACQVSLLTVQLSDRPCWQIARAKPAVKQCGSVTIAPACIVYDRKQLLSLKTYHSELAPAVCDTLLSLGILSDSLCKNGLRSTSLCFPVVPVNVMD